jgi:Bacterial inner membrane protein.
MHLIIAQGIGFIGMTLGFMAFQQPSKRKILLVQATGALFFAIHFFMLGSPTGMGMNLLGIPRNLVFSKEHGKKQTTFFTILFVALFAIFGFFTWESPVSLFPIIGMSLSTVVFSFKNPRLVRLCSLPVSLLWLIYNVMSLSIAGILTESFCVISILIAIFRFDLKKKEAV